MTSHIEIAGRSIGPGQKSFVIAEVAQAHDGSLGYAHSFIDAAADAGADAIKFQTHIASAESTKDEKFRVPLSGQDETRYAYWRRMEFTPEQWAGLASHAIEKGLIFLSSAFSVEAVELLTKINMPAWKLGSGEFKSHDLLESMMRSKKPVLFSTGMSRYEEVSNVVNVFQDKSVPYSLFQCTSHYPTALEDVGLNVLEQYRQRYNCPVGLSDHTGSVFPSLAAMAQKADMIEVHVTFDRAMYGPDVPASLTFSELSHVCAARDAFDIMARHAVDKDVMATKMKDMRDFFTKSIALKGDLKKGTVLQEDMLLPKKPGTGIPYTEKSKVIGATLKVDVASDRLLRWEDIENAA